MLNLAFESECACSVPLLSPSSPSSTTCFSPHTGPAAAAATSVCNKKYCVTVVVQVGSFSPWEQSEMFCIYSVRMVCLRADLYDVLHDLDETSKRRVSVLEHFEVSVVSLPSSASALSSLSWCTIGLCAWSQRS